MKKIIFSIILSLLLLVHSSRDIRGEDFCVDNISLTLQDSLDTATANDEDDLIQIVKGIYIGNFVFSSIEGKGITIRGGYEKSGAVCVFPALLPSPSETILDGGSIDRVLTVNEQLGGDIVVERLTIRNGNGDGTISPIGDGGGLFVQTTNSIGKTGDVIVAHNIIENNKANRFGGVWADSYGTSGDSGVVTLSGNIIRKNSATTNTGGAHVRTETGGNDDYRSGNVIISNNFITNNTALNGNSGGLNVHLQGGGGTGNLMMTNNLIAGNTSKSYSGGAHIYSFPYAGPFGNVIITNNIITDNSSNNTVGGLYMWARGNYDTGDLGPGNVTFTHNTLSGNSAPVSPSGGGLRFRGPSSSGILHVYNNIVWGNTAPTGGDIYLTGFQVTNGYNNDYSVMVGDWDNRSDNINRNPIFIGGGDYHLQAHSPCANVGALSVPSMPTKDIDGDNRIIGHAPDIGADEVVSQFPWILFIPKPAD